jgi:hypothetical protein
MPVLSDSGHSGITVSMSHPDATRRAQVILYSDEGSSVCSILRMTGIAKITVAKLLVEIGPTCSRYQDEAIRNLHLKRTQCEKPGPSSATRKRTSPLANHQTSELGDHRNGYAGRSASESSLGSPTTSSAAGSSSKPPAVRDPNHVANRRQTERSSIRRHSRAITAGFGKAEFLQGDQRLGSSIRIVVLCD